MFTRSLDTDLSQPRLCSARDINVILVKNCHNLVYLVHESTCVDWRSGSTGRTAGVSVPQHGLADVLIVRLCSRPPGIPDRTEPLCLQSRFPSALQFRLQ